MAARSRSTSGVWPPLARNQRHAALGGGGSERLVEVVRFLEQALADRQLGRVDRGLGERDRLGGKRRDAERQPLDERPELGRAAARGSRSRSARPCSAEKSSQPRITSSARPRPTRRGSRCVPLPPGNDAERHLGLRQHRAPERREAHVERQHELAAAAARRPSILAIVAFGMVRKRSTIAWKKPSSVGFGGTSRGSRWISATSACAMKKSGLALSKTTTRTCRRPLELAPDAIHLLDERQIEEVDRRMVDGDERDAALATDAETLVTFVRHGVTPAR